jgi:hypothetical protein
MSKNFYFCSLNLPSLEIYVKILTKMFAGTLKSIEGGSILKPRLCTDLESQSPEGRNW